MEASTLTHAQKRGLFSRPSPLLRFQGDDRLVTLTRKGNQAAFEALVQRYQPRLLGFCRQMLRSAEDAEDVLQEVFVAAYNAMCADEREIAVRPWLYRIARNRCLNHLRRPVPDGQDSMDVLPVENGASTHDRVQNREEFRNLLTDVHKLPETQRSALLLREMDAMSYEEIAQSMDTTVPGVKSLLVRARIALAESSQARLLTCDEVKIELAEAAEGLGKASGPVRRHLRECNECKEFRSQLRTDSKALAALLPIGPFILLKGLIVSKLGLGGGGAGAAGGGACAAGGGACAAAGGGAAAAGGAAGAAGGIGAVGGAAAAGGAAAGGAAAAGAAGAAAGGVSAAIGTKVGVGLTSAVLLTAGAAEVKHIADKPATNPNSAKEAGAAPQGQNAATTTELHADDAAVTAAPGEEQAGEHAAPGEEVVEPTPADGTAQPTEATTGGVLVGPHAKGKRKRKRKIAVADSNEHTAGSGASGTETSAGGDGGSVTSDDASPPPSSGSGSAPPAQTPPPPPPTLVNP